LGVPQSGHPSYFKYLSTKFKTTIKLLQKLPGVGPRQAARFVLALLERNESELREIGQTISNLKREVRFCNECFNISENLPIGHIDGPCHICTDTKRDQTKLLVLEKVTDLDSIEKTGLYRGLYHVLGGSINPLDGATADTLKFKELTRRVNILSDNDKGLEIIIATNPNASGETTSLYIKDLFKDRTDIILTRLGRGLASGSNLEYADETTLRNALEYRK
jgi:recombination protein RecR